MIIMNTTEILNIIKANDIDCGTTILNGELVIVLTSDKKSDLPKIKEVIDLIEGNEDLDCVELITHQLDHLGIVVRCMVEL